MSQLKGGNMKIKHDLITDTETSKKILTHVSTKTALKGVLVIALAYFMN